MLRWEDDVNEAIAKKFPNVIDTVKFQCDFRDITFLFSIGIRPQGPAAPVGREKWKRRKKIKEEERKQEGFKDNQEETCSRRKFFVR